MLLFVRVGQTVLEDAVDESLIAVLGAGAKVREVVGGVGHGLGAASNNHVRSSEHDVLSSEDDGLETGGADLVHRGGDGAVGEASANGTLAGRGLAKTR